MPLDLIYTRRSSLEMKWKFSKCIIPSIESSGPTSPIMLQCGPGMSPTGMRRQLTSPRLHDWTECGILGVISLKTIRFIFWYDSKQTFDISLSSFIFHERRSIAIGIHVVCCLSTLCKQGTASASFTLLLSDNIVRVESGRIWHQKGLPPNLGTKRTFLRTLINLKRPQVPLATFQTFQAKKQPLSRSPLQQHLSNYSGQIGGGGVVVTWFRSSQVHRLNACHHITSPINICHNLTICAIFICLISSFLGLPISNQHCRLRSNKFVRCQCILLLIDIKSHGILTYHQ